MLLLAMFNSSEHEMHIGQEVMIIGDSRCPIGQVVRISGTSPCDMGDHAVLLYQVTPMVRLRGMEVYFQPQHLMPIDAEPIVLIEQMHIAA
jgi:hypothetical protein